MELKAETHWCKRCGDEITRKVWPYMVAKGIGVFCSGRCASLARFSSLEDRFKSCLSSPDSKGCILWSGAKNQKGYGYISKEGVQRKAHRVAWEIAHGPIPDGLVVCHKCDVPSCVNIEHLFLGTNSDNMRDMVAKGRHVNNGKHGAASHFAKLNEDMVAEIRRRHSVGGVSQTRLGKEFNVSAATVCEIVSRKTWAHLPGPSE
jgi:hypothetical protein